MAHATRTASSLAAASALLLLALAAPASAQAAATPVGSGSLGVGIAGEPLALAHDANGAGVGDDVVSVREGVRELEVRWDGAPLGASFQAGLRGLAVHHGASPLVADALDTFLAALPLGLRVDLSSAGVEPFVEGASMFGSPFPLWTTGWHDTGHAGVGYDAVTLPTALVRDTDDVVAREYRSFWFACWGLELHLGAELPGCDPVMPLYFDAAPNVAVLAELQTAVVEATPSGSVAGGAEPAYAAAATALPDAQGVAGVVLHGAEAPFARDLHATAGPTPPIPQALPAADEPRREGASALAFAGSVVSSPIPLALVVGALALLAPVWALYRRILPHRALAHPVREQILERVRAQPGIHESDLARAVGLRHNHVQYHVRVLEDSGILETRPFGGLKCIFELGRLSPGEKAFAMAQRGRSQEVLQLIADAPGIAQRELARRLGMSESSAKWHLDRLEGSGVVRTERAHGAKRAWPIAGIVPVRAASVLPPAASPAPL